MLSMVHSSPWCTQSVVELNLWWSSIRGGLLLCCLWTNRARSVIFGCLVGLGAVVPLLCSHSPKFCVQEWRRMETQPGHPKPCGWSVEFSAEMGITHRAEPCERTLEHLSHGGIKRPPCARAGHSQPSHANLAGKLLGTLQLIPSLQAATRAHHTTLLLFLTLAL